jgi:PASTA domain
VLVQALAHYQGTEQLLTLSTAENQISMKVAGYTPMEALCCPGVVSVRRWVWTHGRFQASPAIVVTRIVMPKIVGLPSDEAIRVLVEAGIASFSELGPDESSNATGQARVVKQSPAPGTIIHPPNIQVTVTLQ